MPGRSASSSSGRRVGHVQLDLGAARPQGVDTPLAAPHQEATQVRLGVDACLPTVAGEVGDDCPHQAWSVKCTSSLGREGHNEGHTTLPCSSASRTIGRMSCHDAARSGNY